MERLLADYQESIQKAVKARQLRWATDLASLMVVVILLAAAVITICIRLGLFTFLEGLPIYLLLAAILPVWRLAKNGNQAVGYLPAFLCLALGIYGTILNGYITSTVLFYALAVVLASMIKTSRAGFIFAGASFFAYSCIGYFQSGKFEVEAMITVAFALIGLALLQGYMETRFHQSLETQVSANEKLQEEAKLRRLAELTQREQEAQLRRLAENTNDLVAEVDPEGVFRYASPSYQWVLGYDSLSLVGTNVHSIIHPDDADAFVQTAREAAASRQPMCIQARVRSTDGHFPMLEVSGSPLFDDKGEHTGFVLASRDISERLQAASAVQESETKFRNIIEMLPLGIHIYHLHDDGRLIFSGYNPAADSILEIDHSRMIGLPIEDAFPGLTGGEVPVKYRQVAGLGGLWKNEQVMYTHEDIVGAYDVHAFQTTPGKIVAVFSNITERLKGAEALRISEEKFSTAFLTSPDAININRLLDGVYLDINQGFTRIMGYTRDDVYGKSSLELEVWVDPADRARLVQGLQARGFVENLEARFRRKNGEIVIGLMSARVIVIQGEKCILSITRDISERMRSELELRNAHSQLEQAYEATLLGWARALELRERETADHSHRVVTQTVNIARAIGFRGADLVNISRGAMLHDIGKVGVPDSILLKPGRLTDDEWVSMRQHVEFARAMLEGIEYLHGCMDIPCYHHEKWDGTGYPTGLKGEEIPLPARIFAIVDVYDALTHDRPYRPAWSAAETRRYLREQRGKHFEPAIVDMFLKLQGTGSLM